MYTIHLGNISVGLHQTYVFFYRYVTFKHADMKSWKVSCGKKYNYFAEKCEYLKYNYLNELIHIQSKYVDIDLWILGYFALRNKYFHCRGNCGINCLKIRPILRHLQFRIYLPSLLGIFFGISLSLEKWIVIFIFLYLQEIKFSHRYGFRNFLLEFFIFVYIFLCLLLGKY